ncbi:ARM repeat-containing protein [Atractiella rhizophila]|nr:ARM repeat-containing protein [Atractiella rhizophila]
MSDPPLSDVQGEITSTARRLVRTFPVAPGSTPVTHIVQHLAAPHNLYPLPSGFRVSRNGANGLTVGDYLNAQGAEQEDLMRRAVGALQGTDCPIRSIPSPYALPNDQPFPTPRSLSFPSMPNLSARVMTALNPHPPARPQSDTSAPPAFQIWYGERDVAQQRAKASSDFDQFLERSLKQREKELEAMQISEDIGRFTSPSKSPSTLLHPFSASSALRTPPALSSPDPLGFGASSGPSALGKRKSTSDINPSPSKRQTFSLEIPIRPSPPTTPRQFPNGRPHKSVSSPSVRGTFPVIKPSMLDGELSRKKGEMMDLDEEGGAESVQHSYQLPSTGASYANGGGPTNERLEKFQDTLDDIFEAENFLASDEGYAERATNFFAGTEKDSRLKMKVVNKLDLEIRATEKKGSVASIGDTVEVGILQRLLKILERSASLIEEIDVVPQDVLLGKRVVTGVEEKKGKGKKKSEGVNEEEGWSDQQQIHVEAELAKVLEGLSAIQCQFSLMTTSRFPRLALSEDGINAALRALKKVLEDVVYPFVEASNTERHPALDQPIKRSASAKSLADILQAISSIIPSLTTLLTTQEMSEEIVVPAVFIAIGPFFVESAAPGTKTKTKEPFGATALRSIRLSALLLLRTIYSKREDQRQLIMEEILGSLIKLPDPRKGKGQFRLRNGRSIHTVSALLLHLVQTCSPDVFPSLKRTFEKPAQEEVGADTTPTKSKQIPLVNEDQLMHTAAQKILSPVSESASRSARSIVMYLLNKSGKGGKATNSNETEYRAVLDNFVADLLTVLHLPEWPAADFVLTLFCRSMIAALEDTRTSADITAAKTISLDHLGAIGARIRQNVKERAAPPFDQLTKIVSDQDTDTFSRLVRDQKDIMRHLFHLSRTEPGTETAAVFLAVHWGQDIYHAWKASSSMLETYLPEDQNCSEEFIKAQSLNKMLQEEFERFWDLPDEKDPFGPTDSDEDDRLQDIVDRISQIQGVRLLKDPLLDHVLQASDSTVVTFRTKALRALAQIVAVDPELFVQPNVRKTIESRVKDSSPAVRDAAIELVGKYIVQKPELSQQYLALISERIADTGLSVRKRVVKLLKTLYIQLPTTETRAEISKRLLSRVMDEDDNVKESAMQAVEELWFNKSSKADAAEISSRAAVLMAVAGTSPLDEAIKFILKQNEDQQSPYIFQNIQAIFESLVDMLVDPPDGTEVDIVGCMKTVYILTSANPAMVSPSKAQMLLPYLKSATTSEDAVISDYLLKTFRLCVKSMPKSASKFAHDLQATLMPMINKPSNINNNFQQGLQELIACFCAVVNYQTKEYSKVISVFKACNKLLINDLKKLKDSQKPGNLRNMLMVTFIVSFVCEYSDLDMTRKIDLTVAAELDTISKRPISDHVYDALMDLYSCAPAVNFKVAALQCLGYIFRSHASLMLKPKSFELMDGISNGDKPQLWATLLRIFQDVLSSQTMTSTDQAVSDSGKVDTKVLIGDISGKGFADSGVGSAIVQRYTQRIFRSALSHEGGIQRAAMDVLSFTVKQGLCHPISCMPTIVALESSTDNTISNRALALHGHLQSKHASLINTRFLECCQTAYEYQSSFTADQVVVGYRGSLPTALLSKWWLILKEKRTTRLDFIAALVKAFFVEPEQPRCSVKDLLFALFIASNMSALEYRTQEDVFTVLYRLNRALSTSAYQTLQVLENDPRTLKESRTSVQQIDCEAMSISSTLSPLSSPSKSVPSQISVAPPRTLPIPSLELCRLSQIIMLAMRLKNHLKELYGISEASLHKFQPTKKSHDKPAVKKNEIGFFDCTLHPLDTLESCIAQRDRYIEAIQSDGTLAEPVYEETEE